LGGKLYDANGVEFRMRGVNRCHFDSPSKTGIINSKSSAVRMFMYALSQGAAEYAGIMQTQHLANKQVGVLCMPQFPDGTLTSGNTSDTELQAGVAWWVANAAAFKPLEKNLIINIANEWSGADWQAQYITAVQKMRTAGYLGPLMIDANTYGQNYTTLLTSSTAVFNADPQKNLIFSWHIYGNTPTAAVPGVIQQLAALGKSNGACYVVGEFGPGRNIGPSPTLTTPDSIVTECEAAGLGWLAWAWDDNDEGGGASDDTWFSMTRAGPGLFTGGALPSTQLTTYGNDMVAQIQKLAVPATTF
jgi:mannan endo-1,4-beta-mannosidase